VSEHPSGEFLAVLDTRASQILILDGENLSIVTELD
jgi:hypothetical protein